MTKLTDVLVPDIGTTDAVDVIEIMVKPGDHIQADDAIITLESDKASMEVPAPVSGIVKELFITVGDKIKEGQVILSLEAVEASSSPTENAHTTANEPTPSSSKPTLENVYVPDIGGAENVDIIEVLVKPGDTVKKDDAIVTLESDKASMEIPSPFDGTIEAVNVSVGDKISEGGLLLSMMAVVENATQTHQSTPATPSAQPTHANRPVSATPEQYIAYGDHVHAGPSSRRLAREYGVPLDQVTGSGEKGRITQEDIKQFVRSELSAPRGGLNVPPAPKVDHAKFGEIEIQPLNKIKKLTGQTMSRNWLTIPHVTQFAQADITDMEAYRQELKSIAAEKGLKVTPLVFIMKALVESLKAYPQFNASLDETGDHLIIKKHYHIGIAVDTPNGLVVPVVRDVDQKDIFALADELSTISSKAREKGLTPAEMAGSSFTISSLGGIGGTAFTPIVKAPDVAILGVSKAAQTPVFIQNEFVPRLMLPLCLSYDHRVIDGADGARFIMDLSKQLADIREQLSSTF